MPAPSPSWSTVNAFATYRLLDGTPDAGSVRFTIGERIVSATDDVIFASGGSFDVPLGANTGTISVALPAVDDPDISPTGWSIKVEELLKSGKGATYYIQPKLAHVASGFNLRPVIVPAASASPPAALLKGVPGGVAALDSAGDVVNAAGVKVTGSGGTGTVTAASITDATTTGRALLKAADAATARAAISAGTSSLTLGTTSTTAKAGNYTPTKADVGLGNVDNTSDDAKPLSAAAVTALSGKVDFVIVTTGNEARPAGSVMTLWNEQRTGTPTAPTNMNATTDFWLH